MAGYGLPMPGGVMPAQSAAPPQQTARVISIGGFLPMGNLAAAQAMGAPPAMSFDEQQGQPIIANLAAHIKNAFTMARQARLPVEQEMIEAMLARRGKYTAEKLSIIENNKQPAIYMMVASAKMRQVESLVRDVLIGVGAQKPWTLDPTPVPELPPEIAQSIIGQLAMEIEQAMMSGFPPTMEAARARAREMRDEVQPRLMEEARRFTERMEDKMEDQLIEGGFLKALDEFITDLATFKTAFLAGPVIRKKPKMSWGPNHELIVEDALVLEWERVDPFDIFPARYARNINDGPLIRKHRLSREDIAEMMGVEGYSDDALRKVLDQYGTAGLREWLAVDAQKAHAEGKTNMPLGNEAGLIDALQFWGTASGKLLRQWGMNESQVPDEAKEYKIEAWMIGPYVIKAVLNADPLGRRNLYCTSFQKVPGSVWGNSPYDLLKDCQDMCNSAARALAANLGISSGPQVAIISNRLPAGEDVTDMFPWKVWQFESDPMGSTAAPITFFQPQSNAAELMTVYERFSTLADEYTGIPRYMAGFDSGGAGRTASGMSMMISNASKIIKQVVGFVDSDVIAESLQRLYYHNMRYGEDPDLKGDVNIVARGAESIAAKEAAQVRTNEFLQIALQSPAVQNIIGMEGLAELLRPTVKRLDMNPDKVVPPLQVLRQRAAEQMQQQMLLAQQAAQQGGAPDAPGGPKQGPPHSKPKQGQRLQDGAPVTDAFEPARA